MYGNGSEKWSASQMLPGEPKKDWVRIRRKEREARTLAYFKGLPKKEKRQNPLSRPYLFKPFVTIGSAEWGPDHEHRGLLAAMQNSYNRKRDEVYAFLESHRGPADEKTHTKFKKMVAEAEAAYDKAVMFEQLLTYLKSLTTIEGLKESGKLIQEDISNALRLVYEARELNPVQFKVTARFIFVLFLGLLPIFSQVACTNTVGTPDQGQTSGEVVNEGEEDEAEAVPTNEPILPSPAPPAVTPESDGQSNGQEEQPVEETQPPVEESPVAVGTRIPDDTIEAAAAAAEITLTPEAVNEFNPLAENGSKRVMYRIAVDRNSIQLVISTDSGATASFIEVVGGTIEQTPEAATVKSESGAIVISVDKITAEVTQTPEAEAAPTPDDEETPPPEEEETEVPPVEETPENPFTIEQLETLDNVWPQNPDADAGYMAKILVMQENLALGNIDLGNCIVKALSSVHYLDANGNQQGNDQSIWALDGGLCKVGDTYYPFFGTRSLNIPIPDPAAVPPQNVVDRYEDYLRDVAGYSSDYEFGSPGEILEVDMVIGENQMAQTNVDEPNGSSDLATYGSGMTRSWSEENARLFWETGDPQYLPVFPEGTVVEIDGVQVDVSGQHYIPALRVGVPLNG